MKTFVTFGLLFSVVMIAGAAEPAKYQTGPKNLVSPTYRVPIRPVGHQLTKRDIAKMTVSAETASQHLTIANYYAEQAEQLDARGAAYEKAAAGYRSTPVAKSLVSPTTPGRFEFIAKGFRDEAKSDRALATSHEQMAKAVAARL